jgi:hypothetical protein
MSAIGILFAKENWHGFCALGFSVSISCLPIVLSTFMMPQSISLGSLTFTGINGSEREGFTFAVTKRAEILFQPEFRAANGGPASPFCPAASNYSGHVGAAYSISEVELSDGSSGYCTRGAYSYIQFGLGTPRRIFEPGTYTGSLSIIASGDDRGEAVTNTLQLSAVILSGEVTLLSPETVETLTNIAPD